MRVENHRTEDAFQRHVILKSFPILAANSYVTLLYIAFVERTLDLLATQVATFFAVSCIANILFGFGWRYGLVSPFVGFNRAVRVVESRIRGQRTGQSGPALSLPSEDETRDQKFVREYHMGKASNTTLEFSQMSTRQYRTLWYDSDGDVCSVAVWNGVVVFCGISVYSAAGYAIQLCAHPSGCSVLHSSLSPPRRSDCRRNWYVTIIWPFSPCHYDRSSDSFTGAWKQILDALSYSGAIVNMLILALTSHEFMETYMRLPASIGLTSTHIWVFLIAEHLAFGIKVVTVS